VFGVAVTGCSAALAVLTTRSAAATTNRNLIDPNGRSRTAKMGL
jgi:hypothetical protein